MAGPWMRFRRHALLVDGTLLHGSQDVVGNGDCWFHSVIASDTTDDNFFTVSSMRESLFLFAVNEGNAIFKSACKIFKSENMTEDEVLRTIKESGCHVGTIASILLAAEHKIRILVVSRGRTGFYMAEDNFKNVMLCTNEELEEKERIYMLHHEHNRPLEMPIESANHYAPLSRITKDDAAGAHLTIIGPDNQESKIKKGAIIEVLKKVECPGNANDEDDSEYQVSATEASESYESDDVEQGSQKKLIKKRRKNPVVPDESELIFNALVDSWGTPEKDEKLEEKKDQIDEKKVMEKKVKPESVAMKKKRETKARNTIRTQAYLKSFFTVKEEKLEKIETSMDIAARAAQVERKDETLQIVSLVLGEVLHQVEKDSQIETKSKFTPSFSAHPEKKNKRENLSWMKKAFKIFIFLHPKLLNRDVPAFEKLLGTKAKTLRGWMYKADLMEKWVPFLENMTYGDVQRARQIPFEVKNSIEDSSKINLDEFKIKISGEFKIHGSQGQSGQALGKQKDVGLLKGKTKRIVSPNKKKKTLYPDEEQFLVDMIKESLETGRPMTKNDARYFMEKKYRGTESSFDLAMFGEKSGESTFRMWFSRKLKKYDFSMRSATVSQSLPDNFIEVAKTFCSDFNDWNNKVQPDYLIAADETFMQFYHPAESVIAKTGSKKVVSGVKMKNLKGGATIMVSAEMYTGQVLEPFIIMDGTWNGNLMREYAEREKSTVVFTKNHWMSSNAFIVYLATLTRKYKGRRIGLLVDHFRGHYSEDVMHWISRQNDQAEGTKIFMLLVPKGMTSVLQVGDVGINHDLKTEVKSEFAKIERKFKAKVNYKTGNVLALARPEFLDIVEKSFERLNQNKDPLWIRRLFRQCGQDPEMGESGRKEFERHLEDCQFKGKRMEKPKDRIDLL